MKPTQIAAWLAFVGMFPAPLIVAAATVPELPPAAASVDFTRQLKPLLESSCLQCHAHGQKKGGYQIDSRELFLQGGDSGPGAVAGKSADSLVVQLIAGHDPDRLMPAKGEPWTPEQIGLLRAWIDQGLPWPETAVLGRGLEAALEPRAVELPPARRRQTHPLDRLTASYFAQHGIQAPRPVGDRVFARRAYLDVIGLLPTPAELKAFEKDRHADKRARLVRKLLADSPRYAAHWLTFWNDALRNDYRGTGYIDGGRKQITPWLYTALATNLPYDQFVARLVNPDEHSAGFAKGIVWRGAVNASQTPPVQAAQNISQVFMGINLKCASCHDSFTSNWKLADAYGLAGIYADEPLEMVRCDKPLGEIAARRFLFPQLGEISASTNRAERLESLAQANTHPQNGRLTRTVVNRLWARLMGRGLVEPVDEMDNLPWSADLLDWLAADLAANGYDLKHTLAQILTSQAYAMPAVSGSELADDRFVFRGPLVKRLTAEQYADALSALTGRWHSLPANLEIDFAAGNPGPPDPQPAPRWIWAGPDAAQGVAPGSIYLRKTFHLDAPPAQALIMASADNRFRLLVNGTEIGSSDDWNKVRLFDVREHLIAGENLIAVEATNDKNKKDESEKDEAKAREKELSPNPAGFILQARIRPAAGTAAEMAAGNRFDLGSDASWLVSTNETDGWEKPGFGADGWQAASDLGAPQTAPWNLERRLAAVWSSAAQHGTVRASLVATDPLMTALGRPNREQVNTTRPSAATTLQALELTNGTTLAEWLQEAAGQLLKESGQERPRQLVTRLYLHALGRKPTAAELKVAGEIVGSPIRQDGLEDLLWAMSALPEFQLIY
ncbi:MAG: DUF1549 domain-containing protein [Limisphaerales bacterium]